MLFEFKGFHLISTDSEAFWESASKTIQNISRNIIRFTPRDVVCICVQYMGVKNLLRDIEIAQMTSFSQERSHCPIATNVANISYLET